MLKFSVITVCYHAERIIRKTIESVLSQTYPAMELLIIDGGSTDGTLSIIEDYCSDKRLLVYSEKDDGIYNAMNRGIARASGEYIYFLNAGDIFYNENVLKKISEYLVKNHSDILVGNYIEKRHEIAKLIYVKEQSNWIDVLEKGGGICHQAIFAHADCLKEGFDEHYKIAADYNWLCRQVNSGRKITCTDIIISEFDVYGISSLAKTWWDTREECRRIVEKNFPYRKHKIEQEIEMQYKTAKNQKTLEYLSDLLALKQRRRSLKEYFQKNSVKEIAIYGFQHLGQRLLDELEHSEVCVKYVIDRDHSFQNIRVPLKLIEEALEPVDMVVVTPIFEFYHIKQELDSKLQTCVVSIEDIINSMYEQKIEKTE